MNRIDDGEHPMDILFLLTPGFTDSARDGEGKRYYCPDCAFLEGVLGCCPELRTRLDSGVGLVAGEVGRWRRRIQLRPRPRFLDRSCFYPRKARGPTIWSQPLKLRRASVGWI
jgi:hypothetical protein